MSSAPDQSIIDDELLIIRHSGEIPEVALHGSIFFLTIDPHGPQLTLDETVLRQMKKKVVDRYQEMIARDLDPGNRDKSIYRGLARCIVNWQRLEKFCTRENFVLDDINCRVTNMLLSFIKKEKTDVARGRNSSINCSRRTLGDFAEKLGVDCRELPNGWQELCLD